MGVNAKVIALLATLMLIGTAMEAQSAMATRSSREAVVAEDSVAEKPASVVVAAQYATLNDAFAHLPATGGEVHIGGGVFRVTEPIHVSVPVTIECEGIGRSIIQPTPAFRGTVLTLDGAAAANRQGWTIRHCAIEMSDADEQHAIRWLNLTRPVLDDVLIQVLWQRNRRGSCG